VTSQNNQQRQITVIDQVERRLSDIQKMLPGSISIDEFFSQFKLAAMKVPGLLDCTPRSVMIACMQAAADGLMLDGREAAIVIHNAKKKGRPGERDYWVKEATYFQMYQGQLKRIRADDRVVRIEARTVHHKDKFSLTYGDSPTIEHVPAYGKDRGEMIGAYAIVTYKDGTRQHEFMEVDEIEAIRNRSRGYDPTDPKGPWHTDFSEMAKKTVLRRIAKLLPQSSGQRADQVDADDIESAADAIDMLDFDRPAAITRRDATEADKGVGDQEEGREAPAQRGLDVDDSRPDPAPEQPTSRIPDDTPEPWRDRLYGLEAECRLALDRGSVEEAWTRFDTTYADPVPPKGVLKLVKMIVDDRLAQLTA
jgi:phage RecT family recombinase